MKNKNKGFSLVEVLIALAVFILGIVSIGFLILDSSVSSRQGIERTQAILLAHEGLSAARAIRDNDFDDLTVGTHGIAISSNTWIFSGSSDTQDQFTRTITVTDIDSVTKQIQSTVAWQFSEGRQSSVDFTTYLTDWNQTSGTAGDVLFSISGAVLISGDKQLEGITIANIGSVDITIDKITATWSNGSSIEEIRIDGDTVWKWNSTGLPSGRQASGVELDIVDKVITADAIEVEFDQFKFDSAMTGDTFTIVLTMTDGSTKSILNITPQ